MAVEGWVSNGGHTESLPPRLLLQSSQDLLVVIHVDGLGQSLNTIEGGGEDGKVTSTNSSLVDWAIIVHQGWNGMASSVEGLEETVEGYH